MDIVMGFGSLALFTVGILVAVPFLLSLVMLVPMTLKLRNDRRAAATVAVAAPTRLERPARREYRQAA